MPKRVEMPDGQIKFFGDMESPEEIRAQIQKQFPDAYKGQGELAARGAARGFAGDAADAMRLSHLPGIGAMFPPAAAWNLASKIPGDPLHTGAAEQKLSEFGNAETPSGAEWMGWAGSQVIPGLLGPTGLTRPLTSLAKSGLKKGGEYALEKFGFKQAEKGAAKVATGPAVGPKPKVRLKADGRLVEVANDGTERTASSWTRRQMEKHAQIAKGQPTSSTAFRPGEKLIGSSPDAEHAELKSMMHEAMNNATVWGKAKHLAKVAGIPTWMALGILSHHGRNVAARGVRAGAIAEGRALSGENPPNEQKATGTTGTSGPVQTNPPALPQDGGSPR